MIIEALRLNTELARTVIDQFPAMMMATAEIMRAADGAGLPARLPRVGIACDTDDEEDTADGSDPTVSASPTLDLLNQLAVQLVPVIVANLAPKLGSVLDDRKALPAPAPDPTPRARRAPNKPVATTSAAAPVASSPMPTDPAVLAKVMAVQAQLTPGERERARRLGDGLSPAELQAFFDQLATLSVREAVAKVRSLITGCTRAPLGHAALLRGGREGPRQHELAAVGCNHGDQSRRARAWHDVPAAARAVLAGR
jgi:hypothetical protein